LVFAFCENKSWQFEQSGQANWLQMATRTESKLPRIVRISHPRYRFSVVFYDGHDKRQKHYFAGKKEAVAFFDEALKNFSNQGRVGIAFNADERADWGAAKSVLELAGATCGVLAAVRGFLADHPPGAKETLFSAASAAFAETKRRVQRSDRTVGSIENTLAQFGRERGIVQCSDITTEEIEKWVFQRGRKALTAVARLTVIRGFCRWACKPRNGFLAADPTADIERPHVAARVPETLNVEEVGLCLAFADTQGDAFRCYVYLCALAGLRQSEAVALPADALAAAAKTGVLAVVGIGKRGRSQRQVPVCARLCAVLAASAGVRAQWHQKPFRAMKAASGAAARWCNDILRHTWVSHRLAFTGDAARTAMEAGHDQATMSRYYVAPKTEADAKRFFGE
jgi:integrase